MRSDDALSFQDVEYSVPVTRGASSNTAQACFNPCLSSEAKSTLRMRFTGKPTRKGTVTTQSFSNSHDSQFRGCSQYRAHHLGLRRAANHV